jgi:hypothetical protein
MLYANLWLVDQTFIFTTRRLGLMATYLGPRFINAMIESAALFVWTPS